MHEQLLVTPELFVPGADERRTDAGLILPSQRSNIEVMRYPEILKVHFSEVNPFMVAADINSLLDKYHPNWQGQIQEVSRQRPVAFIQPGFDDTSMAEPGSEPTIYHPTGKSVIAAGLPWAHDLFTHEINFLVEKLTNDPSTYLGPDDASLSISEIREGGYELHFDRSPFTMLLGVTNIKDHKGGELKIYEKRDKNRAYGQTFTIKPEKGILYGLWGEYPHLVTPYFGHTPRVIMAAAYFNKSHPHTSSSNFNIGVGVL